MLFFIHFVYWWKMNKIKLLFFIFCWVESDSHLSEYVLQVHYIVKKWVCNFYNFIFFSYYIFNYVFQLCISIMYFLKLYREFSKCKHSLHSRKIPNYPTDIFRLSLWYNLDFSGVCNLIVYILFLVRVTLVHVMCWQMCRLP